MISETIKKLIRLATNNSNEHEANLAARKACQLLVEDKSLFPTNRREQAQVPKQEATIRVTENPRTRDVTITVTNLDMVNNSRVAKLIMELDKELRGARTWNDVHRSEESFWSSKPPSSPPPPKQEPTYRPPKRDRYGFRSWIDWDDIPFGGKKQPTPEDYATGKAKPYDPTNPDNYSKSRPPRDLKCNKCGKTVSTQFVGPPQVFECADCAYGEEFEKHTGRKP